VQGGGPVRRHGGVNGKEDEDYADFDPEDGLVLL
jgi:hypothetical protein